LCRSAFAGSVHVGPPLYVPVSRGFGAHHQVTHRANVSKDSCQPFLVRGGFTSTKMFIEMGILTRPEDIGIAACKATGHSGRRGWDTTGPKRSRGVRSRSRDRGCQCGARETGTLKWMAISYSACAAVAHPLPSGCGEEPGTCTGGDGRALDRGPQRGPLLGVQVRGRRECVFLENVEEVPFVYRNLWGLTFLRHREGGLQRGSSGGGTVLLQRGCAQTELSVRDEKEDFCL
jgi:hypothetical protein